MTGLSGPIPLAPRPLPGEGVLSWVSRVAARYDLAGSELIAGLRGGDGVRSARMACLDWREDPELEALLARATRLDRARIGAMRLVSEASVNPAVWRRRGLAWCPDCVRADVARHGETYGRAAWRLGCCVVCPLHRFFLVEVCTACGWGRCHLQARRSRQRLVCEVCARAIDALPQEFAQEQVTGDRTGWCGLVWGPAPLELALAMQAALLAALAGATPALARRCGVSAGGFIALVSDLVHAVIGSAWLDGNLAAAPAGSVFAAMEPRTVLEVLGIVAALIENALAPGAACMNTLSRRMADGRHGPIDLAWCMARLSDHDLRALRDRARAWKSVATGAVRDAIDQQIVMRRDADLRRERERREAAWVRQATIRYVVQARKRIQARVARKAERRRSLCRVDGVSQSEFSRPTQQIADG
jgi:hypothetical protein